MAQFTRRYEESEWGGGSDLCRSCTAYRERIALGALLERSSLCRHQMAVEVNGLGEGGKKVVGMIKKDLKSKEGR